MALSQQQIDNNSLALDASVRVAMRDGRVDKFAFQNEVGASQFSMMLQGSNSWYVRNLVEGLQNVFPWDPAFDWLKECDKAGPITEIRPTDHMRPEDLDALQALTREQIQHEELNPCFLPQPQVETALNALACSIHNLCLKTTAYQYRNPPDVAHIVLTTAGCIFTCMADRWNDYRHLEKKTEFGMVAKCINMIRANAMTRVLQYTTLHCEQKNPDFLNTFSPIFNQACVNVKAAEQTIIPSDNNMAFAQEMLRGPAAFVNKDIAQVFEAFDRRRHVYRLSNHLKNDVPAFRVEAESSEMFFDPAAKMMIGQPHGEKRDGVLWYGENGKFHTRMLGVSTPTVTQPPVPPIQEHEATVGLQELCVLDDNGKIHINDADRLLPAFVDPTFAELQTVVGVTRSRQTAALSDLRRRFSTLFAFASDLGPYTFLRRAPGDTVLVCPKQSASLVREILESEPLIEQELAGLLRDFRFNASEAAAFGMEGALRRPLVEKQEEPELIEDVSSEEPEESEEKITEEPSASVAPTETPTPSAPHATPSAPEPVSHGKRLRTLFGRDSVPSLEWIIEHMKPFGHLWEEPSNVGSEGWLCLQKQPGEKPLRFRTWHSLRHEAESPGWKMLYWVLRKFDITVDDFCAMWEGKKKK
jgi:hypothetical protein